MKEAIIFEINKFLRNKEVGYLTNLLNNFLSYPHDSGAYMLATEYLMKLNITEGSKEEWSKIVQRADLLLDINVEEIIHYIKEAQKKIDYKLFPESKFYDLLRNLSKLGDLKPSTSSVFEVFIIVNVKEDLHLLTDMDKKVNILLNEDLTVFDEFDKITLYSNTEELHIKLMETHSTKALEHFSTTLLTGVPSKFITNLYKH